MNATRLKNCVLLYYYYKFDLLFESYLFKQMFFVDLRFERSDQLLLARTSR
jgi:hypothetical protein